MTSGVREIMEREHNFGSYADEDDGTHILGKTTVLLTGNAAALAAVANMQEGALFLQDDGTNLELFLYTSAAWVNITDDAHGSMANLTDDLCHTQYMLKDTAYDLGMTFDMNDQRLSTLAAAGVPLVADHPYDVSPHSVAANTALLGDSIDFITKLGNTYSYSLSGSLHSLAGVNTMLVALPTNLLAILAMRFMGSAANTWHVGALPSYGSPNIAFWVDNPALGRSLNYSITVLVS